MAFFAIHLTMFSFQGKVGKAVVERAGIDLCETLFIMTISALQPEFAFVHILMAGIAGLGFYTFSILENDRRRGIQLVAGGTIDVLVRPLERKLRFAVIESFQTCQRGK